MRRTLALQRTGNRRSTRAKADSLDQLASLKILAITKIVASRYPILLGSRRRRKNVVKSTFTLRTPSTFVSTKARVLNQWAYPLGSRHRRVSYSHLNATRRNASRDRETRLKISQQQKHLNLMWLMWLRAVSIVAATALSRAAALRPNIRGGVNPRRRLEATPCPADDCCPAKLEPIPSAECPPPDSGDVARFSCDAPDLVVGNLCRSNAGECGTDKNLDNCEYPETKLKADIYRVIEARPVAPTAKPTSICPELGHGAPLPA